MRFPFLPFHHAIDHVTNFDNPMFFCKKKIFDEKFFLIRSFDSKFDCNINEI